MSVKQNIYNIMNMMYVFAPSQVPIKMLPFINLGQDRNHKFTAVTFECILNGESI